MTCDIIKIGLKAKTESVPTAQLFARSGNKKTGNYDMAALGWQADYPDPENFINVLFDGRQIPDEGSSNNWSFFNSAKFNSRLLSSSAPVALLYSIPPFLKAQSDRAAVPSKLRISCAKKSIRSVTALDSRFASSISRR